MQPNGYRAGANSISPTVYVDSNLWLNRTDPGSPFAMPKTVATKPYDWTYTTTYPGHQSIVEGRTEKWVAADPEDKSQSIPIEELTRPDPILFYAEIPLFEDELHDNGSSISLVRIVRLHLYILLRYDVLSPSKQRVMPTCIFVLSRFTLRVDNVLFRTYDTRFYISLSSSPPLVIRETSGWEAPYERVQWVGYCSSTFPCGLLMSRLAASKTG